MRTLEPVDESDPSSDVVPDELPATPRRLTFKYDPGGYTPSLVGDSTLGIPEGTAEHNSLQEPMTSPVLQALHKLEQDVAYISLSQNKLLTELKEEVRFGFESIPESLASRVNLPPAKPDEDALGWRKGRSASKTLARDRSMYDKSMSPTGSEIERPKLRLRPPDMIDDRDDRPRRWTSEETPRKGHLLKPDASAGQFGKTFSEVAGMVALPTGNSTSSLSYKFVPRSRGLRAQTTSQIVFNHSMKEAQVGDDVQAEDAFGQATTAMKPAALNHRRLRRHVWHACCCPRIRLPIPQDGKVRLLLDTCSMCFLFYDSLTVPYFISWGNSASSAEIHPALSALQVVSTIFWTIDMCLGFLAGDRHYENVSLRVAATRYLKTWFILDFTVVVIDWSGIVMDQLSDEEGAPTYLKLIRILKMGRMLRIMTAMGSGRFAHMYNALLHQAHRVGMETQCHFGVRIVKIILIILWLNHIGGCLFYMMVLSTRSLTDTGLSWRDEFSDLEGVEDVTTEYLPQGYLYLKSFYWSLTAMFAGESFLLPTNTSEAYFAVSYIIFGMMFASSLISSLSAMLVDFQMISRDSHEAMRKVQEFLFQQHVDTFLSTNVAMQIMERMAVRPSIGLEDVSSAVSLLSVDLRQKLWHAIYGPKLARHHFLRTLDYLDDRLTLDVCFSAVSWWTLRPGEEVFESGCQVPSAYYVMEGSLLYQIGMEPDPDPHGSDVWFCEMALWVVWETLGRAEANIASQVMQILWEKLWKLLEARPEVRLVAMDYSVTYAGAIAKERPPLTDMDFLIDHDNLVALMTMVSRRLMSLPALTALKLSKNLTKLKSGARMEKLEAELEKGGCDLREDLDGKVVRVVRVVATHIVRSDNLVCIELGEQSEEDFRPTMVLPGTKIRHGEYPMDAMRRLLGSMNIQADKLTWKNRKISPPSVKASPQYGVDTKYVRTVFYAALDDEASSAMHGVCVPYTEPPISTKSRQVMEAIPHISTNGTEEDGSLVDLDIEIFEVEGKQSIFAWLPSYALDYILLHPDKAKDPVKRWVKSYQSPSVELGVVSSPLVVRGVSPSLANV